MRHHLARQVTRGVEHAGGAAGDAAAVSVPDGAVPGHTTGAHPVLPSVQEAEQASDSNGGSSTNQPQPGTPLRSTAPVSLLNLCV